MPDETPEIQITVPPEQQVGAYANFAAVSAQTPFDFNLDFIQLGPGAPGEPPAGTVVARIKVAEDFLMPLMQALASHQTTIEGLKQGQEHQEDDPE